MKLYIYALIFALMVGAVSASSAEYCGTTCLDSGNILYSVHTLYGGDNAIMEGDTVVSSSVYNWKMGETVDFSLQYDPITDLLTYTIDGNVMQIQTEDVDYFDYLVLQGQTSFYGSNSMTFTDMTIDGKAIDDFSVTDGIAGIKLDPSQKFFTLEGKVRMDVDGNTNKNMAGLNIYLLENTGSGSKDKIGSVPLTTNQLVGGDPELPEFGVVAASLALIGAAAIFAIKRKN